MPERCDIFCRVVDNFGDVGVCWRLARQLSDEYQFAVRLFIDDLDSLACLVPASRSASRIEGVTVRRWIDANQTEVADLVVEAFGCELPVAYLHAMARRTVAPNWIVLEYLSAETWIESHHLLGSAHRDLALERTFFFPGFTDRTGGLLRERGLMERLLAVERAEPRRLSQPRGFLFGYPNPCAAALLDSMRASGLTVTVPQGSLAMQLLREADGSFETREFVPQVQFDQWMLQHEVLFVRGEDSMLRAQWLAKPFVWQIYPQADDAHLAKLDAFVVRYCVGLDPVAATALRSLWLAWNRHDVGTISGAWQAFWAQREALTDHARRWRDELVGQADLAARLVTFYRERTKI